MRTELFGCFLIFCIAKGSALGHIAYRSGSVRKELAHHLVRSHDGLLLQPRLQRARLHGHRERHVLRRPATTSFSPSSRLTERDRTDRTPILGLYEYHKEAHSLPLGEHGKDTHAHRERGRVWPRVHKEAVLCMLKPN